MPQKEIKKRIDNVLNLMHQNLQKYFPDFELSTKPSVEQLFKAKEERLKPKVFVETTPVHAIQNQKRVDPSLFDVQVIPATAEKCLQRNRITQEEEFNDKLSLLRNKMDPEQIKIRREYESLKKDLEEIQKVTDWYLKTTKQPIQLPSEMQQV